jgi:glycerol uptake facilitator-like aquaporin
MTLTRRLVAEAVGTALLVATVVGSGVMADALATDDAMALMGNAIPTGAILFVLITVLGPISGAHFNPAVTMAFALRGEIDRISVAGYVAAQIVGGIVGSLVAHLMFDLPALQLATHVRTGASQWLSEAVATFGLVAVVLGGVRAKPQAVPALVGLYITAAYWFTASTSFANPAVTVARALTDTFTGIRPIDAAAFIFAQLAGALLALGLIGWLYEAAEAKH